MQSGIVEDLIYTKILRQFQHLAKKKRIKLESRFHNQEGEANDTLEGGEVVYQVASEESILLEQDLDYDEKLLAEESLIRTEAKSAYSSCDINSLYQPQRGIVRKFGVDEWNSKNIISLTIASKASQKSKRK